MDEEIQMAETPHVAVEAPARVYTRAATSHFKSPQVGLVLQGLVDILAVQRPNLC